MTTSVSGSSLTGLYAADGSYNIVLNTSNTWMGLYHPCGAYNAVLVTDPSSGYYAANGSVNVIQNSDSSFSPVVPLGERGSLPTNIIDEQFTTGTFFPGPITSDLIDTRSTTKFVTNASGSLVSIAANSLPISNAGMLVEPAATNSILQSQALATTPWSAPGFGAVLTNNAATAPDGTTTATSFADTATSNLFQIGQAVTLSGVQTISFYLKAGSQSFGYIQVNVNGATDASAQFFGLTGAGTVGSNLVLAGGVATTAASIKALANGWYLCSITTISMAGVSTIFVGPANINNNRTYTGTGAVALFMWGANNNGGSYVPTSTVAATRAADAITVQHTGIGRVVFTFDDNSQQTISGINPASQFTVPTNLNRPLITRMTGFSS